MKKIIIPLCFLLCACSNTPKESTIELDEGNGEVVAITLEEVSKKMDDNESFVVVVSQTYCGACMSFFFETDEYTEEVGLTLYDIKLDDEGDNESKVLSQVQKLFDDFSTTPTIYLIEDGKVVDSLNSKVEELSLDSYKTFLNKYGIGI